MAIWGYGTHNYPAQEKVISPTTHSQPSTTNHDNLDTKQSEENLKYIIPNRASSLFHALQEEKEEGGPISPHAKLASGDASLQRTGTFNDESSSISPWRLRPSALELSLPGRNWTVTSQPSISMLVIAIFS